MFSSFKILISKLTKVERRKIEGMKQFRLITENRKAKTSLVWWVGTGGMGKAVRQ
jgi:hypothetical protein